MSLEMMKRLEMMGVLMIRVSLSNVNLLLTSSSMFLNIFKLNIDVKHLVLVLFFSMDYYTYYH